MRDFLKGGGVGKLLRMLEDLETVSLLLMAIKSTDIWFIAAFVNYPEVGFSGHYGSIIDKYNRTIKYSLMYSSRIKPHRRPKVYFECNYLYFSSFVGVLL
jgi:hypothetical protein